MARLRAHMGARLRQHLRFDRRAMTAWEYSLIAALIAVVIITSLSSLGVSTLKPLTYISANVAWTGNSGK